MIDPFSAEHLKDIEAAIAKINCFLDGKSFEEFRDNDMLRDAVLRNLTMISEASRRVGGNFKAATPEVNWSKWAEMSDRLIGSYDTLDDRALWETIEIGLPELTLAAKRIQQDSSSSPQLKTV